MNAIFNLLNPSQKKVLSEVMENTNDRSVRNEHETTDFI